MAVFSETSIQYPSTRTLHRGHLLQRLQRLGPPEPLLVGAIGKPPTQTDLREGRFEVYEKQAHLFPPIDWQQDPHQSRSWRYHLHTLAWLKPLLLEHSQSGDQNALSAALKIIIDWSSTHLDEPIGTSEFAWYDMAVGLRAPYLAYALRACLVEEMLDGHQAHLLLWAVHRHGAELAEGKNYSADHNHGLFQDEGLYLLARQLPMLPAAPAWSDLAVARLQRTLASTICESEGSHLEHSSSYQFAVTGMVRRLTATVRELPTLHALLERLRDTAVWHVMPGGRVAQLGDTDDNPAEKWAQEATATQLGLKALFGSGYAFVRNNQSYLAVSAGYHGSAHKHSDETGFLLAESGQILLGDAGRWGYYENEPDRRYARSAHAHNVLTVDDEDFAWRQSAPYESGLLGVGEGHGWYAILVANPVLVRQGVEHRRLLLYHPAKTLIAIDKVHAGTTHNYARRFHFGPGIKARIGEERRVEITGGGEIAATLVDLDGDTEIELDRGIDKPARLGWTYPRDRDRAPAWTATMRSRGRDATLVAVLTLGGKRPAITDARLEPDGAVIETDDGGVFEIGIGPDRQQAEIHLENWSASFNPDQRSA